MFVLLAVAAAAGCGDGDGDTTTTSLRTTTTTADATTTTPNGRMRAPLLAYLSRMGDPGQLVTVPISGGAETVVTDQLEPVGGYDWSPDGTEIVFTRFVDGEPGVTELVIRDVDGSNARVLTTAGRDDRYPAFSPDGQRVVFTRGPARAPGSGLYVIERAGSGLQQLVDEPDAEPLFPTWSPDGRRIAYERFPDGGEPGLAVIDADGTNLDKIAERAVRPAWSPDGEWIAFASSQAPGSPTSDLYTIRPDGTDRRRLAADVAGGPAWSPDAQLIAFATEAGLAEGSNLAVVAADGTGERVLADVRPHDGSPTWSPDGRILAFVAAEIEGATDVYTVDVDGGEARAVTSTGAAEDPHFSPT